MKEAEMPEIVRNSPPRFIAEGVFRSDRELLNLKYVAERSGITAEGSKVARVRRHNQ